MGKKIKILHVGLSSNYGGIESFVVNYFKIIDKNRFVFDFADIYGNGIAYKEEIEGLGGTVFSLPNYKKHPLKMRREYIALIERGKYDIIHIHMLSCANIIPIEAARRCKHLAHIIGHSHNSSIPTGLTRRIMHFYNALKIRNLTINKWACGEMAGQWMWGEDFVISNVIANAIDPSKFKCNMKSRNDLRRKCGFTENDFVIGFVGTFSEQKNVLFLASVLEKLCKINDTYRLLMLGDGALKEEFTNKLQEKNISELVYFAGIQNNAYLWYSAMDCFVLPSKFEGLPFVAIEAQAAGLQSYISNFVTTEIKVTNSVEYLSIDNDGSEWANKIASFCSKYGVGYRHNENIPDKYDINKSCKNLENKYLELLEEK